MVGQEPKGSYCYCSDVPNKRPSAVLNAFRDIAVQLLRALRSRECQGTAMVHGHGLHEETLGGNTVMQLLGGRGSSGDCFGETNGTV